MVGWPAAREPPRPTKASKGKPLARAGADGEGLVDGGFDGAGFAVQLMREVGQVIGIGGGDNRAHRLPPA